MVVLDRSLQQRCVSIVVVHPPNFLRAKEGSLKRKEFINIQMYVSDLQNGWVKLAPFYVLVFYKKDGWHWVHSVLYSFTKCIGDIGSSPCVIVLQNGWVILGPFYVLVF